MDSAEYYKYHKAHFEKFESICKRCGECCGTKDDDTCLNLAVSDEGNYYCKIYENRFGPQRTTSGRIFNCVPIREAVRLGFTRPNCSYNYLALGAEYVKEA